MHGTMNLNKNEPKNHSFNFINSEILELNLSFFPALKIPPEYIRAEKESKAKS
jgi:hypothetical protein